LFRCPGHLHPSWSSISEVGRWPIISPKKRTLIFFCLSFSWHRQYTLSISDSFDGIRLSVSQLFYIYNILGDFSQLILGGCFGLFNEGLTFVGKSFYIKNFIMIISWAQIMCIYYQTSAVQVGFFVTILSLHVEYFEQVHPLYI
jgi:hypothetical protein